MASIARPRQRRRLILTCIECRKRKQKCDRKLPCTQCVAREERCHYENHKTAILAHSKDSPLPPNKIEFPAASGKPAAILRHAQDYGYSDSDSLNSLGMLKKVIVDTGHCETSPQPTNTSQMKSKSSEYFGFVRRIPSKRCCDMLFQFFFVDVNPINSPLDETIFAEQLDRWWGLAHSKLLGQGLDGLPEDMKCFPALVFQVLAVALQFLPSSREIEVDELKFGPSQTMKELSKEYSDCGVSVSKIIGKARLCLVGVQHSFLRDWWLINTGDLMQAWSHSGETVKDAMAIGLHLEPEVPSSSQAEELLDYIWTNELKKRVWLNLVVWDNAMALAQGRPMFISLQDCTVTPPTDCIIPIDRIKRVPVGRTENEGPTPMTERVLRLQITRRFCEIRELEAQGPIPRDSAKVKELHHFAIAFRKSMPEFYRTPNPNMKWDVEYPFVSIHRELLGSLVDSFLMALHRPYVFTREKSQRQVYESALAILDSQERLFQIVNASHSSFFIGCTFPTFDASILLAVVLVSNPERYRESFQRPCASLKRALDRLEYIGPNFPLAKTGAAILQTTLCRVLEAQERARHPAGVLESFPGEYGTNEGGSGMPASLSPDSEAWHFDINDSVLDWTTTQNDEFPRFDLSNLEAPMPLKELLMEEEMTNWEQAPWEDLQGPGLPVLPIDDTFMDNDNEIWNFLAGYSYVNGE